VKWINNSYELLSCGYDDTIRIWHYEDEDWHSIEQHVIKNHEGTVWAVDSHNGIMVSVGDDTRILVWLQDADADQLFYKLHQEIIHAHSLSIYSCSLNCNG
jgi:WD40 repeat protein